MSLTLRPCTDARSSVYVHAVHPLVLYKKATNQPKQIGTSYKTSAQTHEEWQVHNR